MLVYETRCLGTGPGASLEANVWTEPGEVTSAEVYVNEAYEIRFPLEKQTEVEPVTMASSPTELLSSGSIQPGFSRDGWGEFWRVVVEVDSVPEWEGFACPPDTTPGFLDLTLSDGEHFTAQ